MDVLGIDMMAAKSVNSAKCALASHVMLFISLPLAPLPKSEYNGFSKMTDIYDVTV